MVPTVRPQSEFCPLAPFVNFVDERLVLKTEYINQASLSIRRISVNRLVTLEARLRLRMDV